MFHEFGQTEAIEHTESGVNIRGYVPGRLLSSLKPFEINK